MKCVINPKTGKPYSKHKLTADQIVYGYSGGHPLFVYNVHCTREGCKR